MLPVVNKPLLEHVVSAVAAAGITDIVLVVGYERDRIQTHFGDGDEWGVSIRYTVQTKQLGTAHAVQQAEPYVDGRFLVLNGDRIIEPSIVASVREAILDGDEQATMAVTRLAEAGAYGVVTVEGDRVVDIVEKPSSPSPSEIINAGVYGFTPAVFDAIGAIEAGVDGEFGLTDAIDRLTTEGPVRAVRYTGWWLDVSYPWDLLSVTDQVLDRDGGASHGTVAEGAQISRTAHLAETASAGGNAIVGRGSTVAANARIGPNATVERSVIFPDATIGAGAVLKDCIVGANTTVGPNVTIPSGETSVAVDGNVYEAVTFGGVIGDNASIGGGAVIEPGSILGDEVAVGVGAVVSGTVDDGVEIRRG